MKSVGCDDMAGVMTINNIEQLRQFMNKKGIIEIVVRDKKKKFDAFYKVSLNNLQKEESKGLLEKAMNTVNKNNALLNKNLNKLRNITKLSNLNLLTSGINLCATCAGFIIIQKSLNQMKDQIDQVIGVIKATNKVNANYELNKVVSDHSDMLDSRKKQRNYSEEKMRKLVDDEYNVLDMLIKGFLNDHTADKDNLIISIYSMASMMTVSLRYFDEVYYLNNKETIGDGEVWHSSHKKWVDALNLLLSDEFVEKIQDHGIFDLRLSTIETDIYYKNLCDQVRDMKESIEDNQFIVKESDSSEQINEFETELNHEVKKTIHEAFEQTSGVLDNAEVKEAYNNTLKQMGLAV